MSRTKGSVDATEATRRRLLRAATTHLCRGVVDDDFELRSVRGDFLHELAQLEPDEEGDDAEEDDRHEDDEENGADDRHAAVEKAPEDAVAQVEPAHLEGAHPVRGVAEADARPRGVAALHRLLPAAPRLLHTRARLNIVLDLARDWIETLEVRDFVLAALNNRVLRSVLAHFSEDLALAPVRALRDER